MKHVSHSKIGVTLIEIIVAMAIVVIVGVVGVVALNPGGQFATARNNQRIAHVNTILNSIRLNIADTRTGVFTCAAGDIPTTTKKMAGGALNYDIAPCLVPTYAFTLPFDPSAPGAHYTTNSDYDTGYNVLKNASTGQITVSAPAAELGKTISVTR